MRGEYRVNLPFIIKLLHNFIEIRLLKLLFTYVQFILLIIIFDVHEATNYSIKRSRLQFFNWYSYFSLSDLAFFLLNWLMRMILLLLILMLRWLRSLRLIILIPILQLLLRNMMRLSLIMICLHSRISLCDLITLIKSFWLFGVIYQKMMKLANH